MTDNKYEVFRNVCPRNCYNTCSMLSYVKNGKLHKVAGDPLNGYTQGKLCAKGYAYTEYVYSTDRLRYPLRQYPRGSGNWERISWEQALAQIAEKIAELNTCYGSNLPLAYNKCSGNVGLLSHAIDGMFNSIGSHTKPKGDPCLSAGNDALKYDFGHAINPDPEKMVNSQLIVLWGANPAWTAVHQLKFINQARQQGARLVVIDPIFTPTAAKADLYLQIHPGTDGLLALTLAKLLIDRGEYDQEFVRNHVWGWLPFLNYLNKNISLDLVSKVTGIAKEGILEFASLFATLKPCSSWIGYGFQRNTNGGQNFRAINALMAITGNIGIPGGGQYYLHQSRMDFPLHLLNHKGPEHHTRKTRLVDLNNFASEVLALEDPPVKFLWIANRNPFTQDQDLAKWQTLLQKLELIVTVDLFMTKTAEMSDLVLPAASHFEEFDINVSYWHNWLALNEKTLFPYFEAKSDLQIARELTKKLNQYVPGFSNFPHELTAEEWIEKEFTPHILSLYGLNRWEDLKAGPKKLQTDVTPWFDKKFLTKSGKFEIYSSEAKKNNLPAISKFSWPKTGSYPLRLLSPQNPFGIHSQYKWLNWFDHNRVDLVYMNIADAAKRSLQESDTVSLFNANGSSIKRLTISENVPPGVVVVFQGGDSPINTLISNSFTDMGSVTGGSNAVAFYDIFVECKKVQVIDR